MNPHLIEIIDNMKRYNDGVMSAEIFGFDPAVRYDALVAAPGWKPTKVLRDPACRVTQLTQHAYLSGFLLEKDGLRVAWAQTASGACNLLDHLIICAELQFDKLIFAGAVGGLSPELEVGDLCMPSACVDGALAGRYLGERLPRTASYEEILPDAEAAARMEALAGEAGYAIKRAKVFCTDSIALEYSHLDEIRATGARLIEMETATFFRLAELFEVPAAALLAVSDNSATGIPLLGRSEAQRTRYDRTRGKVIPDLIFRIAGDQ